MFLPWRQACKFQLMNSEPLSQSTPRNAKGSACSTSWMAPRTTGWLRPRTARLGPGAVDVGHVTRAPEIPSSGIARMRDQMHLRKPRTPEDPALVRDGSLVFRLNDGL